MSKRRKIVMFCSLISFVLLMTILITATSTNARIKEYENTRDTRLVAKEVIKLSVLEEVRAWLTVKDLESYTLAARNTNMEKNAKNELYGSMYNPYTFAGAENVRFLDAQYTLNTTGETVYYLLATFEKEGKSYTTNFLVFEYNGKISSLIAY